MRPRGSAGAGAVEQARQVEESLRRLLRKPVLLAERAGAGLAFVAPGGPVGVYARSDGGALVQKLFAGAGAEDGRAGYLALLVPHAGSGS